MKRKKILFTLPNLLGGGAERVVVNIINQLDIEYFDVYLLLINNDGNLHSSITSKIKIINLNVTRTRYSLFKIINKINSINPHIVFSTTYRMNILVLMAAFFINKKIKIFIREPNMPSLQIKNKQLSKLKINLIKFLYNYADKVIAQTDEMKEDIFNSYNIKREKIITFNNPIDINFINKSIKSANNPFNDQFINIVASGRIINQKAYDILIQAFKKVIDENLSFRLYILGEDVVGLQSELSLLVSKLKLDDCIFFKGFVDNPYSYYYYSDLFVLSSRWEGLPNVILENLYLEKPIISTNCISFLSDIIIDKKNGFIVPVDNFNELAKKILNFRILKPKNTYLPTDVNHFFTKHI